MKQIHILSIFFVLLIAINSASGQIRSYDRDDLVIIAKEAGAFQIDRIDSIQEFLDHWNNTERSSIPWKVYIQESSYILAINKSDFSIVSGQTPWRTMELEENNLTLDIQTLNDPLNEYGFSLWIQFNDNGSQQISLDSSIIDESIFIIKKQTTYYRMSFEIVYDYESDFASKQFQGTLQYFVLTPTDDDKSFTEIYDSQPVLDYPRTIQYSNSISDSDITITLGMNSSNYWETGSGKDCPQSDFITNDIIDLKCEQITKSVSTLPLHHGTWSALEPITTKPTDRFQIFNQQGPIKLSINTEIRQNNTEDTGIIDVFLDNFMWIYPKTGDDIPIEIFGDVVNENKGISATYVSSYFGLMLGITLLIKFKLKKK